MKKVRIILTAGLAVALVSGAMAFQAKRGGTIYVLNPATNDCTLAIPDFAVVSPTGPDAASDTPLPGQACPFVTIAPVAQ